MYATDITCKRCSEDVGVIRIDGKFFSRPMRFSKCKLYVAPGNRGKGAGGTCRSELCDTDISALVTFPHGERK